MADPPKQKPVEDAATIARKQELAAAQRSTRVAARERAQRQTLLQENRILSGGQQGTDVISAEARPVNTRSIMTRLPTTAPPPKPTVLLQPGVLRIAPRGLTTQNLTRGKGNA